MFPLILCEVPPPCLFCALFSFATLNYGPEFIYYVSYSLIQGLDPLGNKEYPGYFPILWSVTLIFKASCSLMGCS
uniref:Uncharacterized protein n=1 Tax=Arundo donax TaxID=35708 RepID=A0A0A9HHR3_ARUDO